MNKHKKRLLLIVILILLMLLSVKTIIADSQKINMAYINSWKKSNYVNLINETNNSLNVVSPNYFAINKDGELIVTSLLDTNFINEMHKSGMKVTPFLTNNWDRNLGRKCLENRENFAQQVADVIINNGIDGINVDIENVTHEDRDNYTDFIRLLREKLPADKTVSVAVAANPYGWSKGWHGSYDYEQLHNYTDYLVVMSYDESWRGSPPGPVASLNWVERSIKYAINKGVPSNKIVLGVPFYGRIWKDNGDSIWNGDGIAVYKVDELIEIYNGQVLYDEAKQSPKLVFTVEDGKGIEINSSKPELSPGSYTIWFENEQSIKKKLELVKKYNLKGSAAWSLGFETSSFWSWYEKWLNGDYTQSPITLFSLELDQSSPRVIGTKLKWTANVKEDNLKYRFYIYKDNKQVYKGDSYSSQNFIEYIPTSTGVYKAIVYVIDSKGNYNYRYSSNIQIKPNELKIHSINSDKTNSQEVGESIKWTANANGDNLKYRFYIYKGNNQVYKSDSYTNRNYIEYIPKSSGSYKAIVYVKDSNGKYTYKSSESIDIKKTELKINSITIDKSNPQGIGTKLKWTANAEGYNMKYRWYVYKDGKQVYKGNNYTTQNYLEYSPSSTGNYRTIVYVLDNYNKYSYKYSSNIEIKDMELKINSISSDKPNSQPKGTNVRWTVNAEGNNLKYRFYIYKGNTQVYKGTDYTTQNYIDYIPYNSGKYKAIVYVIDDKGRYDYKFSDYIEIR